MIEIKDVWLEKLRDSSNKLNRLEHATETILKEAINSGATVPEIEEVTGLSGGQIRYKASKLGVVISPAKRGPKNI